MGFKYAHGGFGAVRASAVPSGSALCCGGHTVTIGEVSFHVALSLFFHPVYFRVVWRAKGKRQVQRFADRDNTCGKVCRSASMLFGVLCSTADLFP